jgi:hypothetical protein
MEGREEEFANLAKGAAVACPSLCALVDMSSDIPGSYTVAQITREHEGGIENVKVTLTTGPASLLPLDNDVFFY